MAKKITVTFEQRERALELEKARAQQMAEVFDKLPRRSTAEIKVLRKMIEQAHETLKHYDLMPEPAPISGITETWFVAALARLTEIVDASQVEG